MFQQHATVVERADPSLPPRAPEPRLLPRRLLRHADALRALAVRRKSKIDTRTTTAEAGHGGTDSLDYLGDEAQPVFQRPAIFSWSRVVAPSNSWPRYP